MDKKLGVSVGLLSALCFFAAYSNWLAAVVLLVVILAFSSEYVLKKNAVSAAVFAIVIALVRTGLSWISSSYNKVLTFIDTLLHEVWHNVYGVTNVFRKLDFADGISTFISFLFFVITIFFVIKALKGGEVKVPLLNKMIEKHVAKDNA